MTFGSKKALPRSVEHRLTVQLPPELSVPPVITERSASTHVTRRAATIAPPLRGPRWVAVVGPHRRSLQPVNGGLHLGQRFAIDFAARLDAEDRSHQCADQNASYFNYGEPVLAVSAGRVVEVVDRYPDQIPNDPEPVELAAADGNHVIIRLGEGVFAGYAHLKPGGVRVSGQRVRPGQVIGKLGNSGNTTGPHLHFQLMNRPSLLDDGLPFVLERFSLEVAFPRSTLSSRPTSRERRCPSIARWRASTAARGSPTSTWSPSPGIRPRCSGRRWLAALEHCPPTSG